MGWLITLAIVAGIAGALTLLAGRRAVATFASVFFPSLARKLPIALLTLWFVATMVFLLASAAGGEMEAFIRDGRIDERVVANLKREWGLDRPLHQRYAIHMKALITRFDTQPSLHQNNRTFRDVARDHLPATWRLAWRAMLLAAALGLPIGVFCALFHNRWPDQAGRLAALVGVSVPSFILGSLAVFYLAGQMRVMSITSWSAQMNLWVAAACLGAFPFAAILRLTRASMLEAMREDYVRTARAKGTSEWKVIFHHALRNSLSAVVTYVGPVAAGLLTGSLVVERIFFIPGIGDMFVKSVGNRDMPLILGITVFYCSLLVLANLIVDSVYPVLNPRLRDK